MREGRRGFLRLAGGLAAALGLLWPGRSWGFFRRKKSCSSGPCEDETVVRVMTQRTPVVLKYPDYSITTVKGGGGFFAWGTIDTSGGASIAGAEVTWTGAPMPVPGTFVTPPPAPNTFAYRFDNLHNTIPLNTDLTLNVYYKDSGGMKRLGDQSFFQCKP